jgi:hypothetical protein
LSAGSLRKEPPGCCEGGRCDGKTCPCRSSKNAGGDCSSSSCCSAFFDLFLLFFFFLSPSVSPLLWLKFSGTNLDDCCCCCCGRCAGAANDLRLLLLLGALKGSNDGCAAGQKEEGRNPSNWETSATLRGGCAGGPSKAAIRSAKLRGGRAAAGLGLCRSVGARRWGRAGTAGRAGPAKSALRGASPNRLESPSGSELARREGGPKKPDSA